MLSIIAITAVSATEQKAEAQIIWGNVCCDAWNRGRCWLDNYYPIGSGCFCYGQGNGWVCR